MKRRNDPNYDLASLRPMRTLIVRMALVVLFCSLAIKIVQIPPKPMNAPGWPNVPMASTNGENKLISALAVVEDTVAEIMVDSSLAPGDGTQIDYFAIPFYPRVRPEATGDYHCTDEEVPTPGEIAEFDRVQVVPDQTMNLAHDDRR